MRDEIAQCSLLTARCSPLTSAQVGEWLKPADCKSAPPCEVRRFESFPVHHIEPSSRRERSRSLLAKSRVMLRGIGRLMDVETTVIGAIGVRRDCGTGV